MKVLTALKEAKSKAAPAVGLAAMLMLSGILNTPAFSKDNFQELAWATNPKASLTKEVQLNEIQTGNYLIVGTFSFLSNAKRYVNVLRSGANKAQLAYYPYNNHYYVYLLQSSDVAKVRSERDKIRKEERFQDAWVLSLDSQQKFKEEEGKKAEVKTEVAKTSAPESAPIVFGDSKTGKKTAMKEFKIYINSFDGESYKELKTNVKLIYGEKDKLAGTMESHTLRSISIPVDEVAEVQLECNVFGYRKTIHDLDVNKPLNEFM